MIYFLVNGEGRSAISLFLTDWGKALAPRARVVDYDTLFRKRRLPVGSYIFTGMEHLRPNEIEKVALCWRLLSEADSEIRLLNHPLRAMRRYELLRSLNEDGINSFDVYRLDEGRQPQKFPVFLRCEDDHEGPRSELLASQEALNQAVEALVEKGHALENWMITEFAGPPDEDGFYWKYGAFNVGGRIIPRHLQAGREWMIKGESREVAPNIVENEIDYIETNPHEAQLKHIFDLARINYGRIDYTVQNGRIQVFEINMNPQIVKPGPSRDGTRTPVKALFSERLIDALSSLDHTASERRSIPVRFEPRPFYKRRPGFVELLMRITRLPGLGRFEPNLYKFLIAIRRLWN